MDAERILDWNRQIIMRFYEITQQEIDQIARDAGISTDLLNKRLDKESNRRHIDGKGNVKVGDTHLKNKAYGIAQVRKPALDDVNANYGTNFTMDDLQDAKKNAQIGTLYLKLLRDVYAPKYAPNKDANAYAYQAYATGPNLGKDKIANLPNAGKLTRDPGPELEIDLYDRIKQTTDKLKQTEVGQQILGAINNARQGKVNKDSWVYKNIANPLINMKKATQDKVMSIINPDEPKQ